MLKPELSHHDEVREDDSLPILKVHLVLMLVVWFRAVLSKEFR